MLQGWRFHKTVFQHKPIFFRKYKNTGRPQSYNSFSENFGNRCADKSSAQRTCTRSIQHVLTINVLRIRRGGIKYRSKHKILNRNDENNGLCDEKIYIITTFCVGRNDDNNNNNAYIRCNTFSSHAVRACIPRANVLLVSTQLSSGYESIFTHNFTVVYVIHIGKKKNMYTNICTYNSDERNSCTTARVKPHESI